MIITSGDQDGPIVADAFYEELFRGPDGNPALEPEITKSTQALHVAVKKFVPRFFPPLGSIYSHGIRNCTLSTHSESHELLDTMGPSLRVNDAY
ncbi:hypothetical protein BYT27DRAFT_7187958 [Phlegmacium glaucopus]|nr:hypothetical protein BYT27DRAFT_7187958 [Phlegmacium glaucopus]